MLMQGRGKMQVVIVIVLSDVLFFLQESSQKYTFFTPDNKAGVVSLQKLLVREKAGQDSRGIYLISSNPADPEMFELKVHKPKDKQIWIHGIRQAVQTCPADEDDSAVSSAEERHGLSSARQSQIRHLIGLLRQKDIEQALLLEEKMSLQLKLLTATGIDPPSPPSYRHLVSENVDTDQIWKEVLTAVQEVTHLASSLYTTGTNLSRSVSSAGEHQSATYVSPILPKRAETFGGFDNSNQIPFKLLGRKIQSSSDTPVETPELENLKSEDSNMVEKLSFKNCSVPKTNDSNNQNSQLCVPTDGSTLVSLGREQQCTAIQLSHYVYTLLCIISQLMTSNESYQAQVNSSKIGGEGARQYRHNQQLEELRNLQDKLSAEKTAWVATRDQEARELEERRVELLKLQEQIRCEEEDIKEQREQLFRTMEKLTSKGLIISPNVGTFSLTGQLDDNIKDTSEETLQFDCSTSIGSSAIYPYPHILASEKRKDSKWNKSTQAKSQLPINLISTTNQQKVSQNVQVKQQIPLKLASRLCSSTSPVTPTTNATQLLPFKLSQDEKNRRSNSSGYQRLSPPTGGTPSTVIHSHSRAGSSPAMMNVTPPDPSPSQQNESAKSARTQATPKINDEEIIFF